MRWQSPLLVALTASLAAGCTYAPSPLQPLRTGSIGVPHRGVLVNGEEVLPSEALTFLRNDDRHFASAELRRMLVQASNRTFLGHGVPMVLGDLSVRTGGMLMPHFSHRTGRDVDILLPYQTLDGIPLPSTGFHPFGADGIGFDERRKIFVRLDLRRLWTIVRSLLTDSDVRVQWIFSNRRVNILLLDWARALREPTELVERASLVLSEPHPGGAHDDHIHVRIACTKNEELSGCIPSGTRRETTTASHPPQTDRDLLVEIKTTDPTVATSPPLASPLVTRAQP